jgi:geranylgeranyl diphosphate synthase type I
VIEQTGALAELERLVALRTQEATVALDAAPLDVDAADVLRRLAHAATTRVG